MAVILSLRTRATGGAQRLTVQEVVAPQLGYTLALFIHGFNVSGRKASMQWSALSSKIRLPSDTNTQAGLLLWPSDEFGGSIAAYPRMVGQAEVAGRALGEYLLTRYSKQVVLIGHSMGALVAVEAANWARDGGLVAGLVLLGAAVQSRKLAPADGFAPIGEFGKQLARREVAAYSERDKTLRYFFPLGERANAPFDPMDSAVGLTGEPRSRKKWETVPSRRSSHSYWKFNSSARLLSDVVSGSHLSREHEPAVHDIEADPSIGANQ